MGISVLDGIGRASATTFAVGAGFVKSGSLEWTHASQTRGRVCMRELNAANVSKQRSEGCKTRSVIEKYEGWEGKNTETRIGCQGRGARSSKIRRTCTYHVYPRSGTFRLCAHFRVLRIPQIGRSEHQRMRGSRGLEEGGLLRRVDDRLSYTVDLGLSTCMYGSLKRVGAGQMRKPS